MTVAAISGFTSDRARERFLDAYERVRLRVWPAEAVAVDLPTSFGTTRVYRYGDGDAVPFVLLPGAGGNALSWHPYVRRLGRDRPVIAVEPVGEPGRSVQSRPLDGAGDWARWLDEVLAGLSVDRVHLVGCSFGGWVALRHALHAPDRLAGLVLLDPAGFGRVGGRFLAWVLLSGVAGLAPAPVRRAAARLLRNATLRDDELMALMRATFGFRRRHPVPPPVTDDELRRLAVPALVLLGARSQLYDAPALAAHLTARNRSIRVEVIPGAGHDLPLTHPDLITTHTTHFAAQPHP
ncbi:alpha/beta fold hydrolase [Micromonospora sp. R77]|uniref:alpha/beta fold hydrolase n=1 Tax=Micromonospora sp. R77 TaxID=2925836 RepID=UPI001F61D9A4|nr:alpha/beta fold hydrolase [Micromonospora sp. R77]MCI4064901.1 alpha/beta fold hydrolase [Micromonospora sp. R77]